MKSAFDECIAVASGTAGLVVALRALGHAGTWIAVPATICPNVVAAILAVDCLPLFVDIERNSLGLDPQALQKEITGVSAVIAVHALGEPCRIDEILAICQSARVALIEDCAQADGAVDDKGQPVGTSGDAAVFSYGTGKILDLGGGGLVTGRTPEIHQRLRDAADTLPATRTAKEARAALEAMNTAYKELYNSAYPLAMSPHRQPFAALLRRMAKEGLARGSPRERDAIMVARSDRLGATLTRRRVKRALYRSRLHHVPGITLLPTTPKSAPWRFNIWLDRALRDRLLKSMLADHMKVSSWHPDIRPFLPEGLYHSGPMPNTVWFTEGVLNLWLDDDTSDTEILRMTDEIGARIAAFA